MNERNIFIQALEKVDHAERAAYLDAACAGQSALRRRIEALLRSHSEAGDFLVERAPGCLVEQLESAGGGSADTQGETPADTVDGDPLRFLAPSDKPNVLGRLGHYEALDVVGRGGMGIVLRAFDEKLHRTVAIKVMAPQLAINAAARKRFLREAQAAAVVCNEHVIEIHAVEEADGLPYLVMEYIEGESLQKRLDVSGPLPLREILRIGIHIAHGLAAAHAQGLIHRDIKPANILLENPSQNPLENRVGRVKITDFGLARAVDDSTITATGMLAGTPEYMAPEQARYETLDHRADLFSFGSVLYAMCTGHPPFCGDTSLGVLRGVTDETPRSIQEANPDIPDGLVAIIAKLQAKNPADRFESASEVAELLESYLAHVEQPLAVPMPKLPDLPLTWVSANRRAVAPRRGRLAAVALVVLAVGLGLSEAAGMTDLAGTVIRMITPQGTLVVEVDDPSIQVVIDGQEVGISEVWRSPPQSQSVWRVAFSPDGRLGAAGTYYHGIVSVWDLSSGEQLWRIKKGEESAIKALAFFPDGRRLLVGVRKRSGTSPGDGVLHRLLKYATDITERDDTLRVLDIETGEELRRIPVGKPLSSAALTSDGQRVLTGAGGDDRTARLWDVETGEELRRFERHPIGVHNVALSPDGRYAASSAKDVRLWDVESGEQLHLLDHPCWVWAVAISPDGRRVLTGTSGPEFRLRLWDLQSGELIRIFPELDSAVGRIVFLPDGRRALSCGEEPSIRLWDVETGEQLRSFQGHPTGVVPSLAVSPDGRYALSGSGKRDQRIRLWRLPP